MKQRVTKDEACQRLGKSLATLDRMIKRDEVEIEAGAQGSRHRVWVLLEDKDVSIDIPGDVSPQVSDSSELITLRERVRGSRGAGELLPAAAQGRRMALRPVAGQFDHRPGNPGSCNHPGPAGSRYKVNPKLVALATEE